MSDRSQYLDNLIKEMGEASEAFLEKKSKYIAFHVEEHKKSWKRKLFLENYFLPILVLYIIAVQVIFFNFNEYIFTLAPLLTIFILVILQLRTNLKTNKIDLGQDVRNYGKKQLQVVLDQLFLFKWFKWIIYPAIFISIAAEIIYTCVYNLEFWAFFAIALKLAGMGGVVYFERKSVRELTLQEQYFNY